MRKWLLLGGSLAALGLAAGTRRHDDAASTAIAKQVRRRFLRNLWWGRFVAAPDLPDIYANGHYGQRISLSRNKRLVIVRFGSESGEVDWTALLATMAAAWPLEGNSSKAAPRAGG